MKTFLKNETGFVECTTWQSNCWVNVVQPNKEDKDYLLNELKVPEAFYEDVEDIDERPRIEIEDGWCFVLMRIPYKSSNADLPFNTVPLGVIFKDDMFISICFHQTELTDDFIRYAARKHIVIDSHINFVFRLLLSSSIWFLKYLKQINIQIKKAEKQLENSIRNEDLHSMLRLEKCLVYYTTSLRGNEILTHRLKNLRSSKELYDLELVEDVEIESKQALEMTNIYSDIMSGMMDAYASVISNNLNVVMKRLTSISVIMMLPTLLASYLGMNVEAGSTIFNPTFFAVVGGTVIISALIILIFVKKKWF